MLAPMSRLSGAKLLTAIGLLAPYACGGRSVHDDEQATAGQGAASTSRGAGSNGLGGSYGTGAGVSTGGAVSTGGKASSGTAGTLNVAPPDACTMSPPALPGLLTDFDGSTESFQGGGYYMYQDESAAGGETWPDATASAKLVPVPGGVSGNSLRLYGDFFDAESWGAGMGVWLYCVDVRGLTGLRFSWRSSGQSIDVGVATLDDQALEFGGNCTAMPCIPNRIRVDPPYQPTDDEWFEATIDFADLAGGSALFDPRKVVGVNFAAVPLPADGWAFDLWVDELHWVGPEEGGSGGQPGAAGATGYAGAP
jgi:hypothetical protein